MCVQYSYSHEGTASSCIDPITWP